MQIPLTLPEQTTPLPTRREIQALSPVSPVPGVEGIAETLDPRLALQWTQPVLADHSADLARSVLEGIAATPSDAKNSGGTVPVPLVALTVTWSALAQTLEPLLQRIHASTTDAAVPWPTTPTQGADSEAAAEVGAPALLRAMDSLHRQLTQSDLFAPQHLIRHWFQANDLQAPSPVTSSTPDSATLSRWALALSPDSPTAEQITRLLLEGKMQWQGELLPGIAVQLDREDAWREDPAHPGQVQKGAALRAQIDLPRSGRMTVTAYQWGTHIDLRVHMSAAPDNPLQLAWPQLQDRLAQLDLPNLRVGREDRP